MWLLGGFKRKSKIESDRPAKMPTLPNEESIEEAHERAWRVLLRGSDTAMALYLDQTVQDLVQNDQMEDPVLWESKKEINDWLDSLAAANI